MTRAAVLTVLSLLTLFVPAAGQGAAAFTRISQGGGFDPSISADGRRVAFSSTTRRLGNVQNQTGVNYLWSEGTVVQLTDPAARSFAPVISGDGRVVAFLSTADPTGNNPEHNPELFVWTVAGTVQVTAISTGAINDRFSLSFDGSRLAFSATADLTGGNPDASEEIFVWNGTAFTQLTSSTPPPSSNGFSSRPSISADGRAVAFESNANFVPGRNGDGSPEIFLWRDGVISQVTEVASVVNLSGRSQLASISADGRSIAFASRGNLTGQNPDQSQEMFLWNGASFTQLTSFPSPTFGVGHDLAPAAISGDGRSVAFQSRLNPFGRNADGSAEIFLWQDGVLRQVTEGADNSFSGSHAPALSADARTLAFFSFADLAAEGGELAYEVYITRLAVPPPAGPWLSSPGLPGFEVKVRVSPPGAAPLAGALETDCIAETICVSGARRGRPELFVKVIGPRPNGFLWVQISRFTPSQVEVWVRQIGSGQVNYYLLEAVAADAEDVSGLQDRQAFEP